MNNTNDDNEGNWAKEMPYSGEIKSDPTIRPWKPENARHAPDEAELQRLRDELADIKVDYLRVLQNNVDRFEEYTRARAMVKELRDEVVLFQCTRCQDSRYGVGTVEDGLNSAMGGKPWLTCPDCNGAARDLNKLLSRADAFLEGKSDIVKAREDRERYGQGFLKDGKHIDPHDVFLEPQQGKTGDGK